MISYALTGIAFGLAAGIAPGPLLVLVIRETFVHGTAGGIKTALAPLITDTPIIIATLLILNQLKNFDLFFGILSLAGGCFIVTMAWSGLKAESIEKSSQEEKSTGLRKGFFVNMLSPHPYIFWMSVGSPLIIKASEESLPAAWAFIIFFYICIVGAKAGIAILVGRYKHRFDTWYIIIQRCLACLLLLFAVIFFFEGY